VAMCRHVWLTDRLLLPQTRHVQLRIWLLRRCSTNSIGDWTSSPQSLHSSPLLSASDSGTDPSASSAWETEHSSASTQSVTSVNLVVSSTSTTQWHTAQLTSSHSRCALLLWSIKIHHHHHKSPSVDPTEPVQSMSYLEFSWQWILRSQSHGMWCCVVWWIDTNLPSASSSYAEDGSNRFFQNICILHVKRLWGYIILWIGNLMRKNEVLWSVRSPVWWFWLPLYVQNRIEVSNEDVTL
jgi:hypothetical protein